MQRAYMMALCELAAKDERIISVLADSGTGYDELFRRYYPEQMLNLGISEQNMVAACAGLASCGKIPYAYTAGAFLAYRSMEFIRNDICFNRLNVKLVGMGTGLSWSTLGATHHTTEDMGILRSLPGMMVLSPSCPAETEECVRLSYMKEGPVYLRIGMSNEESPYMLAKQFGFGEISQEPLSVEGKPRLLCRGEKIAVLTTGAIASEVVKAVAKLRENGICPQVYHFPVLWPLNKAEILQAASSFSQIVTIEEHSITGGLGSATAEILSEGGCSARLRRIGLPQVFASGYGTHELVRHANGLDAEGIYQQIMFAVRGELT